jgi:hypothetical protein
MNTCYTYFKIVGNFSPSEVSERLKLTPFKSWNIGDERKGGTEYDFACWCFGKCDEYDVYTENQIRKTIKPLIEKIDILNEIKKENDVSFYIEVVPTANTEDSTPSLSVPLDVIDFCYASRTEIDVDLYVTK